MNLLTHLECSSCRKQVSAKEIQNLCPACRMPLLARYDLREAKRRLKRGKATGDIGGIWKYKELMPVEEETDIVSLGEGNTPLVHARNLGESMGLKNLFIKDESINPTGSFKARGMSAAISVAKQLNIRKVVVPSAGNAASAMAAYAANAGIEAFIFMPKVVPVANYKECQAFGAKISLIDGVISDCGVAVAQLKEKEGWFDVSTLKEPYRIEGKKTMGYELAEQLEWRLPDTIVYPAGGGTGLIGMWKAFDEMEAMGWIGSSRPKMVAVQSSGCAPIVKAFHNNESKAKPWPNPHTVAAGLCVPSAIGDFLMLRILRDSAGTAVMVEDRSLADATNRIGKSEGIFCAPEGAACLPALEELLRQRLVSASDRIVIFNTGSGLKYLTPDPIPYS